MADFYNYFPILIKNEGYWSDNPADTGGCTYMGISQNNYPSWSGWSIIEGYKNSSFFPSVLRSDVELTGKVEAFYKASQWDVLSADQINSQSVANFLVDWYINAGSPAVKHLQTILAVSVDGKIGPLTVSAINSADPESLFYKLQAARKQFYLDVASNNPNDKQFLSNWLSRNESFKFLS